MAKDKHPEEKLEKKKKLKADDAVLLDLKIDQLKKENKTLKAKYNKALVRLAQKDREKEQLLGFQGPIENYKISPKTPSGQSEATAFMIASDWHVEERVDPRTVNGQNKYDLDISRKCAEQYFRNGLRLVQINRQATTIKNLVFAILGDFITNDIHEELVEINQLPPMDAALRARDYLASGIEFLLKEGGFDEIVIPCHSGNHGRTTKSVHVSTEKGHSLEYMMYDSLAQHFKNISRVKFIIADGYHSYVNLYDMTIRFHHGHQVRYGGGVGGIYIPVNKAIAQWNKAKRADLDVFGHFHQLKDGGNFVSNGSMIGYNAYAISIKADYEPPKQAFFLIDRKRGRTVSAPILFDDRMR